MRHCTKTIWQIPTIKRTGGFKLSKKFGIFVLSSHLAFFNLLKHCRPPFFDMLLHVSQAFAIMVIEHHYEMIGQFRPRLLANVQTFGCVQ